MRYPGVVTALVLLSGCSGGGSGPTPTPSNQAPVFSSPTAVNMIENRTLAYYAVASDADGDSITYSISGGADAALFTLRAPNELSFRAPANFERAIDANQDNVYEVQISASDGKVSVPLNLKVTIINAYEDFSLATFGVAGGPGAQTQEIVGLAGSPGQLLGLGKNGVVYHRYASTTRPLGALFQIGDISTDGDRGALGMASVTLNELLVLVTNTSGDIELRRYTITFSATGPATTTHRVEFTIPRTTTNTNQGGWIGVGADGYLYIATGDGGDPSAAQNPGSRLGKVLRLALNPSPTGPAPQYWLPAPGNPFISGGGDPYVFALGLRNPATGAFDGNRLFLGDSGATVEELNLLPFDQPGRNLGWPFMDGTKVNQGTAPAGLVAPVAEYAHGTGRHEGGRMRVAGVYRGTEIPGFQNYFILGDSVASNLWVVPVADLLSGRTVPGREFENRNDDIRWSTGIGAPGSYDRLTELAMGVDGALYLFDEVGGNWFRFYPLP